ncbi:MAG: hypothetical protein WA908_01590 [Pontixanthobacter sp.]
MGRADDDNSASQAGGEAWSGRLSPQMVDFRLLVLSFVRDYIGRWRSSPSYGEIANALDSNKTRVRKAVKSLVGDGMLHRTPGPRGLSLPSMREEALQLLRREGWQVDGSDADAARAGVTDRTLSPPQPSPYPTLDFPRDGTSLSHDGAPIGETEHGEERGEKRGEKCKDSKAA